MWHREGKRGLERVTTRADCERLDAADPLASFRGRFDLPDKLIYLDGNSLGAMPRRARDIAARVLDQEWSTQLIKSWNSAGWFEMPRRLGDKLARLIGAADGEVVVTDTTSANLFKVLAAALSLRPDRRVILSERENLPTDLYVAQGLARLLGGRHELRLVKGDELASALDGDTAVLMATHVNYRTGAMHDMAGLTRLAHEHGALAIWDLAHSAGAMPVDVHAADADFAIGCTYKYLNGGPGAPAFVYVPKRWQQAAEQPLAGWWGHATPFSFSTEYTPAPDIGRYLSGTQPVVSLAIAEAGLDLMLEADMDEVRKKSIALTELFIALVERECAGFGLALASPRDAAQRGSQASFHHPEGHAMMQALIAQGVVGDYRDPGLLRFGFTPLYVRYVDVWDAVAILKRVLQERLWDTAVFHRRHAVT
ncbi:MAG: kynureninase [Burkholderiales bacterium]